MNKEIIYAKADEKFVKAVVLYADASKALFYDKEAKTDKVSKADLQELFTTGVVIVMNKEFYAPICLKSTGLISYDGTQAVTFTAE